MDQGIRSALDKYHSKLGLQVASNSKEAGSKILLLIATFAAVVLIFVVCVRYEVLGAERIWKEIAKIDVGNKTVGAWVDKIGNDISAVFASENSVQIQDAPDNK